MCRWALDWCTAVLNMAWWRRVIDIGWFSCWVVTVVVMVLRETFSPLLNLLLIHRDRTWMPFGCTFSVLVSLVMPRPSTRPDDCIARCLFLYDVMVVRGLTVVRSTVGAAQAMLTWRVVVATVVLRLFRAVRPVGGAL